MLYVCYSGFHWMLISGLMGLPTLLVTSFIHLEFSLESNPGKKPRNGERETEWWICACWGVKIALRFQGCLIFTFFWCSVLLLCPVPEGYFWKPESTQLGRSTLLFHSPALALLHLPFRKGQRNQDVQPLDGAWAGISPSCHTARLEVIDEVPFRVSPYGKCRERLLPCDQWPNRQVSSYCALSFLSFLGSAGMLRPDREISFRPYREIFSWSRTQGKWFPQVS